MAKIAGISGSLAGKVGNIVYSVLKGVNVARQYNPEPYNPNSPAQVEARAKLKMISQLSAIVAGQLAMIRKQTETMRNVFVKINFPFLTYIDGAVEMALANMQLTSGNLGLPGFTVERVAGYGLSVQLAQAGYPAFDKVVWVVYKVLEHGKLMFNESKVCDLTEQSPFGATIMQNVTSDCTIHCYGISTKSAKAQAIFENMVVVSADEVARLISQRTIGDSDVTLSETRGLYFKSTDNEAVTDGTAIDVTLRYLYNVGGDPAALVGGGQYAFGSQVQISAPEIEGYNFTGWKTKSGNTYQVVTTSRQYTLTVGSRPITLYADYDAA